MPETHMEVDKKTCTKCFIEQPIEEFGLIKGGTRRRSQCKACGRLDYKNHSTPETRKFRAEQASVQRIEIRKKIAILKVETGCFFCKMNEPVCLDYHHVDPSTKRRDVASLAKSPCLWKTILKEMAKCICVCSNCHRRIHAKLLKIPKTWR